MGILLVEPDFPIPPKSKNHHDFLPIGLLKLAAMLEKEGNDVQLVRGNNGLEKIHIQPSEIWITSLFTYWIGVVADSVQHYRKLFPEAKIVVGGIAASLFGRKVTKELTQCDDVFIGVNKDAEKIDPELLLKMYDKYVPDVDFQIIHAQRGCFRKCEFCGTWIIEPKRKHEKSIKDKIFKRKIVFYDNNFLHNKYIQSILDELVELKKQKKISWCESQSGFDGRLLLRKPELALKIKNAGFRNVRIAWDWSFEDKDEIKAQLDVLIGVGYKPKDLFVFVLYNWDINFEEMEKKRVKCFDWGVQISDCRYRPLNQIYDNYNAQKKRQTNKDYYIHEEAGWTDTIIKQFRKNVRRQNICVRHNFDFYSRDLEVKKELKSLSKLIKDAQNIKNKRRILVKNEINYWDPRIPMTSEQVDKQKTLPELLK